MVLQEKPRKYSRTSCKRPPEMSSIGGRLQEVRPQKLYNVITLIFSPVQLQFLYLSGNVSIDVK